MEMEKPVNNGSAWTNSDVAGDAQADVTPRPQDDFHAAINHDWLVDAVIPKGEARETAFSERDREVQREVEQLLTDKTADGLESRISQRFYRTYLDMNARDKLGISPMLPYLRRIESIGNLEDLTAYLGEDSFRFPARLASIGVDADLRDFINNVVYVGAPGFSLRDADEYREMTPQGQRTKDANEVYLMALLQKAGYTLDYARKVFEEMYLWETRIAVVCHGTQARSRDDYYEVIYNPRTPGQLAESVKRFPLSEIIAADGYGAADKFILEEPDWLARMDDLYTEDNLEGMKAWLMGRTAMGLGGFLDQECYDLSQRWHNAITGSEGNKPLTKNAYDTSGDLLGMAIGKMYADRYVSEKTRDEVIELIGRVLDVYRRRLGKAEWLGEETRSRAQEKLDAMTVRVGYPTSWPDYSKLDASDGDDLVSQVAAIRRFERERDNAKVNHEVDREEWYMPPQEVNAYYNPSDNSINIPAGILGGVLYDPEGGAESLMGAIGMVIGHETTHAFDTMGSQFDKDGNMTDWWTDEDRAAFESRTAKVKAYFAGIEVLSGEFVNGELTKGETVADLGAMSCMVEIAHTIPGFDFRKMFEAYARVWRTKEPPEMSELLLLRDPHAPSYLRTNATVQQLQEFHDAFETAPGDGMWLDPADRLEVW